MTSLSKQPPAGVVAVTSLPATRQVLRPSAIGMASGQWMHWLQVGGDMAAVSEGQGQLHHEQAAPSLNGATLGLPLHGRQAHPIRQFSSAEMAGLSLADADEQKNESGKVGITARMGGEVFGFVHVAHVAAP